MKNLLVLSLVVASLGVGGRAVGKRPVTANDTATADAAAEEYKIARRAALTALQNDALAESEGLKEVTTAVFNAQTLQDASAAYVKRAEEAVEKLKADDNATPDAISTAEKALTVARNNLNAATLGLIRAQQLYAAAEAKKPGAADRIKEASRPDEFEKKMEEQAKQVKEDVLKLRLGNEIGTIGMDGLHLDNKLQAIERKFDNTVLAAYVREKFSKFTTKVLCKASAMCDKSLSPKEREDKQQEALSEMFFNGKGLPGRKRGETDADAHKTE